MINKISDSFIDILYKSEILSLPVIINIIDVYKDVLKH